MKSVKRSPSTVRKILKYIGKYKFLLPVSIILALITVLLSLIVPILIGEAIDLMLGVGMVKINDIKNILLLTTVLVGVGAISQWLMSTINNRITYNVLRDVRRDAFEKIERLPLSYLDTHSHGDILSRIITDTEQFSDGLLLGFTQLFTGVMTILGTLVLMLLINWQVALVVVILTPLSLFIAKFIAGRTFNMFKEQSKAKGAQTAIIDETITNQKLVLAFGYTNKANEKFNSANDKLERASLRAIFFSSLTNPTTRFVYSVIYAAVALTGAFSALDPSGTFTVGMLSVLLSYANQYTKPFNEISGVITEFQGALASASRVFELIEEEPEIPDEINAPEMNAAKGEIALNGVCFSYNEDRTLIENLSLSVKPGQKIAIVGPTGCGKTTLINLLMRFYDVCSGEIKVDGRNILTLKRRDLRKNFGMVLQDTWMMSGTIKENIAIGKPDATDDEIIEAARRSHAHGFIRRLPGGYDTVIGEDGGNLSQGQKQLISIARVMLTLPPMLILDEATSSIDTRTEMKIQEAFGNMMVGRTSFIVAHRLSTVREADLILVMKDGNIIESGKHADLLQRGGFYAELYNSQFAH